MAFSRATSSKLAAYFLAPNLFPLRYTASAPAAMAADRASIDPAGARSSGRDLKCGTPHLFAYHLRDRYLMALIPSSSQKSTFSNVYYFGGQYGDKSL